MAQQVLVQPRASMGRDWRIVRAAVHSFLAGAPPSDRSLRFILAESLLGGVPESVPGFADLELLETDEPGFFFETLTDENGVRWASRLQTWLELQAGDARQQAAAKRCSTPGTSRVY